LFFLGKPEPKAEEKVSEPKKADAKNAAPVKHVKVVDPKDEEDEDSDDDSDESDDENGSSDDEVFNQCFVQWHVAISCPFLLVMMSFSLDYACLRSNTYTMLK
jgi:hypothetical protein